ncbi:MAG: glucose-6-phosphate dehydrogenase [Bacteroidota bacterium]
MEYVPTPNPLREGLQSERIPDPCIVVIFGASGDLAKRKLIPSLYNLARERMLPAGFSVLGVARSEGSDSNFRDAMKKAVREFGGGAQLDAVWESFAKGLFYLSGKSQDDSTYRNLQQKLTSIERERGTCGNRLWYLATPPDAFGPIVKKLGSNGLSRPEQDSCWVRIILEKPFGRDLESARQLNEEVAQVFEEHQIYRIDHYLGKETVQNLLVFRFANGIFEPIWNRNYVDHIQITSAETIGIENRASYYEQAGALRDMIQNHMLQLLALTAMEPPATFEADAVRDEKVKVFQAIRPMNPQDVKSSTVRAQYGHGVVSGKSVPGYRKENRVDPNSITETFVLLKLIVENWRWAGVPFYIRTGKRLPKRVTEIAIVFKRTPHLIFRQEGSTRAESNVLAIRIQPDEGISLKFGAKLPGAGIRFQPVTMDFRYGTSFGGRLSEAYQRLLLDCMLGDATLYARRDGVEACWSLVTPILRAWESMGLKKIPQYEAGIWGPQESDAFIEGDGRTWRRL